VIPLSLAYDMRAPSFGAAAADLYAAALDQCAWADELGFVAVSLTEHHGADDGYLPSPIVLGSAIAARTNAMVIAIVYILPLHHPISAAEDLAVLDVISRGRLRVILGGGYRPEEFAMFGVDPRRRGVLMEAGVEILRAAWSGRPIEIDGVPARVTPLPLQPGGPAIAMGGASLASARRAARIADSFVPVRADLVEPYLTELDRLGKPRPAYVGSGQQPFVHISENPEADWARIAPHALHESSSYATWVGDDTAMSPYVLTEDTEALRATGLYLVLTPDEAVDFVERNGSFVLRPLMGGLDPELAWSSLRLFERRVLPRLTRPG
jgi:alkanesulfonate monooxygenase SsuD/methylene tetrahydromethanopterin reductase-like flavin-dependent oxidoreductase (luciferase family)